MNREIREQREILLFRDECYAIQGAVFDVYREMGCGFLEAVYQECLDRELELGLLVNFGAHPKVEIVRMAKSNARV